MYFPYGADGLLVSYNKKIEHISYKDINKDINEDINKLVDRDRSTRHKSSVCTSSSAKSSSKGSIVESIVSEINILDYIINGYDNMVDYKIFKLLQARRFSKKFPLTKQYYIIVSVYPVMLNKYRPELGNEDYFPIVARMIEGSYLLTLEADYEIEIKLFHIQSGKLEDTKKKQLKKSISCSQILLMIGSKYDNIDHYHDLFKYEELTEEEIFKGRSIIGDMDSEPRGIVIFKGVNYGLRMVDKKVTNRPLIVEVDIPGSIGGLLLEINNLTDLGDTKNYVGIMKKTRAIGISGPAFGKGTSGIEDLINIFIVLRIITGDNNSLVHYNWIMFYIKQMVALTLTEDALTEVRTEDSSSSSFDKAFSKSFTEDSSSSSFGKAFRKSFDNAELYLKTTYDDSITMLGDYAQAKSIKNPTEKNITNKSFRFSLIESIFPHSLYSFHTLFSDIKSQAHIIYNVCAQFLVAYLSLERKPDNLNIFSNKHIITPGEFIYKGYSRNLRHNYDSYVKGIDEAIDDSMDRMIINIDDVSYIPELIKDLSASLVNPVSLLFGSVPEISLEDTKGTSKFEQMNPINNKSIDDTMKELFKILTRSDPRTRDFDIRLSGTRSVGGIGPLFLPENTKVGLVHQPACTAIISFERAPRPVFDMMVDDGIVYLDEYESSSLCIINGLASGFCDIDKCIEYIDNNLKRDEYYYDIEVVERYHTIYISTETGRLLRPTFTTLDYDKTLPIIDLIKLGVIKYISDSELERVNLRIIDESLQKLHQTESLEERFDLIFALDEVHTEEFALDEVHTEEFALDEDLTEEEFTQEEFTQEEFTEGRFGKAFPKSFIYPQQLLSILSLRSSDINKCSGVRIALNGQMLGNVVPEYSPIIPSPQKTVYQQMYTEPAWYYQSTTDSILKNSNIGNNARVAIMDWGGINVEDAIVYNSQSIDRMGPILMTLTYNFIFTEYNRSRYGFTNSPDMFIPHIGEDGLPYINSFLYKGQPLISVYENTENGAILISNKFKAKHDGRILSVVLVEKEREGGTLSITIRVRSLMLLTSGDKGFFIPGQKGVISTVLAPDKMPYDANTGISVDIIYAGGGGLRRETPRLFVELMSNVIMLGKYWNRLKAETFNSINIDTLLKMSNDVKLYHEIINPVTGRKIDTLISIGYALRIITNQFARIRERTGTGKITRSISSRTPLSTDNFRLKYSEPGYLMMNPKSLSDNVYKSNKISLPICPKCQQFTSNFKNSYNNTFFICHICGAKIDEYKLTDINYVLKYISYLLSAAGIVPNIELTPYD